MTTYKILWKNKLTGGHGLIRVIKAATDDEVYARVERIQDRLNRLGIHIQLSTRKVAQFIS